MNELWPVKGASFESFNHLLKKSNIFLCHYKHIENLKDMQALPEALLYLLQ